MALRSNPSSQQQEQTSNQIVYMPAEQVYAQWASVYDTEGDFLQATDDIQLVDLQPRFLTLAGIPTISKPKAHYNEPGCSVIDLGCGTGRNTFKLRALAPSPSVQIIGLDSSREMLEVAERKLQSIQADKLVYSLHFLHYDVACPNPTPKGLDTHDDSNRELQAAQAIISTLVLEHLELKDFFDSVDGLMRRDGLLLLTNMHSNMGKLSQAGFVDKNGVKARPRSITHTIAEALEVMEKAIAESDVEVLGKRSKKWVGVKCWAAIIFTRAKIAA